MRELGKVILVVALILVLGWVAVTQANRQQGTIKEWASVNGYHVEQIERCYFDHGPFWFVDDDDVIYKVRILDTHEHPRTSYFIFRAFGHDQAWAN